MNDNFDSFPEDPNEQYDSDGDGIGNNADSDDDNDGFTDSDEALAGTDPLDPFSFPRIGITISFLIALSQDLVQILVTLIQITMGLSMEKMTSQPIQIIPPTRTATGFLIRPIPMMIMTG